VWEEFIGVLVAIDTGDGTKDKGSRASDSGCLCETFVSLYVKDFFYFVCFSECFLIKQFPKVVSFQKNVFSVYEYVESYYTQYEQEQW
jgi:hypothetical protein